MLNSRRDCLLVERAVAAGIDTCVVRYMKLYHMDNERGVGTPHTLGRMEVGDSSARLIAHHTT